MTVGRRGDDQDRPGPRGIESFREHEDRAARSRPGIAALGSVILKVFPDGKVDFDFPVFSDDLSGNRGALNKGGDEHATNEENKA